MLVLRRIRCRQSAATALFIATTAATFGATACILLVVHKAPLPVDESAELYIDRRQLDVGEVWATAELNHKITIHNVSSRPITIIGFKKSCSCTRVSPSSLTLTPGSQSTIELSLDLSHSAMTSASAHSSLDSWPFTVEVQPTFQPKLKTVPRWQLKGRIKHSLFGLPSVVTLDSYDKNIDPHGENCPGQVIRFKAATDVGDVQAYSDVDLLSAAIERDLHDSTSFLLRLSLASTVPPGEHAIPVTLRVTDRNGGPLPERQLTATANVLGDLLLLPDAVSLADVKVGGTAEGEVLVVSRSGRRVEVTQVTVPFPEVEVAPVVSANSNAKRFAIRQHIRAAGTHRTTVVFYAKSSDSEDRSQPLTLVLSFHATSR